MDDSFRVRVDKVFGSLTSSSSSSLRSLWSLSDEEIERKKWNRPKTGTDREENPCSSSFDGFFSNQRKVSQRKFDKEDLDEDLDDDEEQQQGPGSSNDKINNQNDEWEIRSAIGLDSTLDNEEEEDEHDKVALGRENAGDRLYMNDITDYGTYLNSHNVLPESFKDHEKDSRANLLAARIRLEEDEASGTSDSFPDNGSKVPAVVDSLLTEDGDNLKSILKRKENQAGNKLQKRVRFDPACKDTCEEELEGAQDSVMVTSTEDTPGVPDYVRNPSKYTRYSFDLLGEVDEHSNQQAYMDFLNMVKSSPSANSLLECPSADLPKSVKFIPKKKTVGDATTAKDISNMKRVQDDDASQESIRRVGLAPGIAAAEVQENEACAMEEDDPTTTTGNNSASLQKTGRRYRSNVQPDDSVC